MQFPYEILSAGWAKIMFLKELWYFPILIVGNVEKYKNKEDFNLFVTLQKCQVKLQLTSPE